MTPGRTPVIPSGFAYAIYMILRMRPHRPLPILMAGCGRVPEAARPPASTLIGGTAATVTGAQPGHDAPSARINQARGSTGRAGLTVT